MNNKEQKELLDNIKTRLEDYCDDVYECPFGLQTACFDGTGAEYQFLLSNVDNKFCPPEVIVKWGPNELMVEMYRFGGDMAKLVDWALIEVKKKKYRIPMFWGPWKRFKKLVD